MKAWKKLLMVAVALAAVFTFAACSDDDDDEPSVVYTFKSTAADPNTYGTDTYTLLAYDNGTYTMTLSAHNIGTVASGTYDASNLSAVKFTETQYYDLSKNSLVSGSKEQTVDASNDTFDYTSANAIKVTFKLQK